MAVTVPPTWAAEVAQAHQNNFGPWINYDAAKAKKPPPATYDYLGDQLYADPTARAQQVLSQNFISDYVSAAMAAQGLGGKDAPAYGTPEYTARYGYTGYSPTGANKPGVTDFRPAADFAERRRISEEALAKGGASRSAELPVLPAITPDVKSMVSAITDAFRVDPIKPQGFTPTVAAAPAPAAPPQKPFSQKVAEFRTQQAAGNRMQGGGLVARAFNGVMDRLAAQQPSPNKAQDRIVDGARTGNLAKSAAGRFVY